MPGAFQPAAVSEGRVPAGWRQAPPDDFPSTNADVKRSRPKRTLTSPKPRERERPLGPSPPRPLQAAATEAQSG